MRDFYVQNKTGLSKKKDKSDFKNIIKKENIKNMSTEPENPEPKYINFEKIPEREFPGDIIQYDRFN